MKDSLLACVLEVCDALNTHKVEYLIVGGAAVAFHGHYRRTMNMLGQTMEKHDIDIWYKPALFNYYNLLKVLKELGEDTSTLSEEIAHPKTSYFRLEFEKFKLDFLPGIDGVTDFDLAHQNKEISVIDDITIPIISKEDLIKNKKTTNRPKDNNDISFLESLD